MPNTYAVDPTADLIMPPLQVWLTGDISTGIDRAKATGEEPIYRGGLSPLHLLAQRGSARLVRSALEAGFALDVGDQFHRTPLMLASCLAGHLEAGAITGALIGAGAAVTATDRFGNSALHYAARSGNSEAFAVLLSAGADPDCANRLGESARALIEGRSDLELVRLLRRVEFDRDWTSPTMKGERTDV